MAARSSLNVSLTPELEKFVQDRVATGRYQTASEVVREALRMLEHEEQDREEALKALKAKLRRRADEAEKMDPSEFVDGEQFFEELLGKLKKRAKRSGAA